MKKFIFTLILAVAAGMTITSCTEELITPTNETGTSGGGSGGGSEDPKP